ncbi:unnamed protein product [Moneuplotes crassus]|uniref:Uncharacterized protein n=1 Tax=Euplotes crassus TaxID=5936 RepID=A0AAD2D7H6_EUPCR|nr:unnamed protein product [Moneuplotes crassus]
MNLTDMMQFDVDKIYKEYNITQKQETDDKDELDLEERAIQSQIGLSTEREEIRDPNEREFIQGLKEFEKVYKAELLEFRKEGCGKRDTEFTLSFKFLRDLYTWINDNCFVWHTKEKCRNVLLMFFGVIDNMRDKFQYNQTQEYLKLLHLLKKNIKLWDSLTFDTQEAFVKRIDAARKRMDILVLEQRRALVSGRRRRKKSERGRKPLTLTNAMIDLSKDGIDRPVYEGLIQAKTIPPKRTEIIGPPCGPPGVNLNPDNLPIILTEEEKIQFHIRVRDEKARREREMIEKATKEKKENEMRISGLQDNLKPRTTQNDDDDDEIDWFASSDEEQQPKPAEEPQEPKDKVQISKNVQNVLKEIRSQKNVAEPERLIDGKPKEEAKENERIQSLNTQPQRLKEEDIESRDNTLKQKSTQETAGKQESTQSTKDARKTLSKINTEDFLTKQEDTGTDDQQTGTDGLKTGTDGQKTCTDIPASAMDTDQVTEGTLDTCKTQVKDEIVSITMSQASKASKKSIKSETGKKRGRSLSKKKIKKAKKVPKKEKPKSKAIRKRVVSKVQKEVVESDQDTFSQTSRSKSKVSDTKPQKSKSKTRDVSMEPASQKSETSVKKVKKTKKNTKKTKKVTKQQKESKSRQTPKSKSKSRKKIKKATSKRKGLEDEVSMKKTKQSSKRTKTSKKGKQRSSKKDAIMKIASQNSEHEASVASKASKASKKLRKSKSKKSSNKKKKIVKHKGKNRAMRKFDDEEEVRLEPEQKKSSKKSKKKKSSLAILSQKSTDTKRSHKSTKSDKSKKSSKSQKSSKSKKSAKSSKSAKSTKPDPSKSLKKPNHRSKSSSKTKSKKPVQKCVKREESSCPATKLAEGSKRTKRSRSKSKSKPVSKKAEKKKEKKVKKRTKKAKDKK